jgi:hypothetical protein
LEELKDEEIDALMQEIESEKPDEKKNQKTACARPEETIIEPNYPTQNSGTQT